MDGDTNKNEQQHEVFKEFLENFFDLVKSSLKDVNVNSVIESNNNVKLEKIKANKAINDNTNSLWKTKFFKDAFVLILILGAIITLSILGILEGATTGTLLGSVIGYSIGGKGFSRRDN